MSVKNGTPYLSKKNGATLSDDDLVNKSPDHSSPDAPLLDNVESKTHPLLAHTDATCLTSPESVLIKDEEGTVATQCPTASTACDPQSNGLSVKNGAPHVSETTGASQMETSTEYQSHTDLDPHMPHIGENSLSNTLTSAQTPLDCEIPVSEHLNDITLTEASVTDTVVGERIVTNGNVADYYVMVHVEAGAMFSVRVGDHIQHIPGPATVRMVSNSGPPLPMPMQVPAGHLVQQIVDEEGILKHVILSLYRGPNPLPHPPQPVPPNAASQTLIIPVSQTNGMSTPGASLILEPSPQLHPSAQTLHQLQHRPHHHHHHHHHPSHLSTPSMVVSSCSPMQPLSSYNGTGPPPVATTAAAASHFHTSFLPNVATPSPPPQYLHPGTATNAHHHHQALQHPHYMTPPAHMFASVDPKGMTTGGPLNGFAPAGPYHHHAVVDLNNHPVLTSTAAVAGTEPCVGQATTMSSEEANGSMEEAGEIESHHMVAEGAVVVNGMGGDDAEMANGCGDQTVDLSHQNESDRMEIITKSLTDENNNLSETMATTTTSSSANPPTSRHPRPAYLPSSPYRSVSKDYMHDSKFTMNGPSADLAQTDSVSHSTLPIPTTTRRRRGAGSNKGHVFQFRNQQPHHYSNSRPNQFTSGRFHPSSNESTSPQTSFGPHSDAPSPLSAESTLNGMSMELMDSPSRTPAGHSTAWSADSIDSHDSPNSAFDPSGNGAAATASTTTRRTPSSQSPTMANHLLRVGRQSQNGGSGNNNNYLLTSPITGSEVSCGPPASLRYSYSGTGHQHMGEHTATDTAYSPIVRAGLHDQLMDHSQSNDMHLVFSEWEREAVHAVLSAIPTPRVSDVKAHSALIHLILPNELEIHGAKEAVLTDTTTTASQSIAAESLNADGVEQSVGSVKRRTRNGSSHSSANSTGPIALQSTDAKSCWTLDENRIQFELYLTERDCSARFSCVFVGEATDVSLQDLRPGSDYHVKYRCTYSDLRGQFSGVASFTTTPMEPSVPRNVTILGHTRTSIHLKWSAALDNGSRITAYCVEYAQAVALLHANATRQSQRHVQNRHAQSWNALEVDLLGGEPNHTLNFIEGFHGLAKTCKLTQLSPSTEYVIRVMAKNAYGSRTDRCIINRMKEHITRWVAKIDHVIDRTPASSIVKHLLESDHQIDPHTAFTVLYSPWSPTMSAVTSGSPPSAPPVPYRVASAVHSITLAWNQPDMTSSSPNSANLVAHNHHLNNSNGGGGGGSNSPVSYILEMDDEAIGHTFVPVFNGPGTEHCVENLRRNTRYRFRLAAYNVDGRSRWTEMVTFATLPDQPASPRDLRVTNTVESTKLTLSWDAPEDDGGIPVAAYRLELRLPITSPTILATQSNKYLDDQTTGITATVDSMDSSGLDVTEKSLVCWPHVMASSGETFFASKPPTPSTRSTGEMRLPRLLYPSDVAPSSTEVNIPSPTTNHKTLSPSESHKSPDEEGPIDLHPTQQSYLHLAWFSVYEGSSLSVLIDHLLPGLQFTCRVRARSSNRFGPGLLTDGLDKSGDHYNWGNPTSPALFVRLPPVPPSAPGSGPRIVGEPNATGFRVCWEPPKCTGGVPIVAYELSQAKMDSSSDSLSDADVPGDANPNGNDSSSGGWISNVRHRRRRQQQHQHSKQQDISSKKSPSMSPYSTVHSHSPSEASSTEGSNISLTTAAQTKRRHLRKRRRHSRHSRSLSPPQDHTTHRAADSSTTAPNGTRIVCSVAEPQCRVSNLRPGRAYAFRVRARNLLGLGPWSGWSTLRTIASPPDAPAGAPRLHPHSDARTVQVRWDAIRRTNGAPITEYWLQWYRVGSSTDQSAVAPSSEAFQMLYNGPALNYEMHGAQPASRLAFRVCAVNRAGQGPWSALGLCCTPPSFPGQPSALRLETIKPQEACLAWLSANHNGSQITSFTVELCRLDLGDTASRVPVQSVDIPAPPCDFESTGNSDDTNGDGEDENRLLVRYTYQGLLPESRYEFRVRAFNALGYGPFSAYLPFSTLPPLPSIPEFMSNPPQVTATSIRLMWYPCAAVVGKPTNANNTTTPHPTSPNKKVKAIGGGGGASRDLTYILQLSRSMDSDWSTVYEGPDSVFKVSRLSENTVHQFRVQSSNATGCSDFSQVLQVSTLRMSPPAVRGLKCTELTEDGCYQLDWTPVTQPSGADLIVYAVQLSVVGAQTNALTIYRGTLSSCQLTNLAPNSEFVARVCAIRVFPPTGISPFANGAVVELPSSQDQLQVTNETASSINMSQVKLTDKDMEFLLHGALNSNSHGLSELSGPYSHSLVINTRSSKTARSSVPHFVSDSCPLGKQNEESPATWSRYPIYWLRSLFTAPGRLSPVTWFRSPSHTSRHTAETDTRTSPSSLFVRHRKSLTGSVTLSTMQQQQEKAMTHPSKSSPPQHHQLTLNPGSRRSQQWFRWNTFKWSLLYWFLFVVSTVVIFIGVLHYFDL